MRVDYQIETLYNGAVLHRFVKNYVNIIEHNTSHSNQQTELNKPMDTRERKIASKKALLNRLTQKKGQNIFIINELVGGWEESIFMNRLLLMPCSIQLFTALINSAP